MLVDLHEGESMYHTEKCSRINPSGFLELKAAQWAAQQINMQTPQGDYKTGKSIIIIIIIIFVYLIKGTFSPDKIEI